MKREKVVIPTTVGDCGYGTLSRGASPPPTKVLTPRRLSGVTGDLAGLQGGVGRQQTGHYPLLPWNLLVSRQPFPSLVVVVLQA